MGRDSAPTAPPGARSAPLGRLRDLAAAIDRRLVLESALVTTAFAFLALVLTWPLAARFGTEITSDGIGWDPAGYTWDLWFNAENGLRVWGDATREVLSAPFGAPLAASTNATLLVTLGPAWIITHIAGPVIAYNVSVLTGLVLSSATTYLLVRWLGLGIGPAAVAGVALMVAPYQLLKATLHIPFVHLWCFPLVLLAGIRWGMRPGWGRAGWLVAAVALSWMTNPYYGLMCTVIAAVVVLVVAVRLLATEGARAAAIRSGQVAGLGVLFVAIPLYALFVSGRDAIEESFSNPRAALDVFGGRISDYVIPDGGNQLMRWVYGVDRWQELAAPGGERTLFVGWVTLALAAAGIGMVAWRWSGAPERVRLAVVICVVSIPLLVWFSLASPTEWLGVRIPVPSEAIYGSAPFYRAYARFGVAALICLLVLAAVGLWALTRGRARWVRLGTAGVAGALMVLNVLPQVPVTTAYPVTVAGGDPRDAASWNWLRDEDPAQGIVFEYPIGSDAYGPQFELVERYWQYGQTIHGRPILNGGFQSGAIGFDFTRTVLDPRWPGVPERLAGAGIETVVVNPWAYPILGQEAPVVDDPPPGFELAEVFPDGTAAWHVTAEPDPAAAIFREGWTGPEVAGERLWWAVQPAGGTVSLVAWVPGEYDVVFPVGTSAPTPRRGVQIVGPEGVLARADLDSSPKFARVRLALGRESTRLRIVPRGGAGPAPVVVGSPRFEAIG